MHCNYKVSARVCGLFYKIIYSSCHKEIDRAFLHLGHDNSCNDEFFPQKMAIWWLISGVIRPLTQHPFFLKIFMKSSNCKILGIMVDYFKQKLPLRISMFHWKVGGHDPPFISHLLMCTIYLGIYNSVKYLDITCDGKVVNLFPIWKVLTLLPLSTM